MKIDWFTFIAQIINFLVLVWLLKRFLYQPILNAIDAREKHVAAQLEDAAKQKTEAEGQRAEFQKKNEEFEQQRTNLLKQANESADAERTRLLDQTRTEADTLRERLEKERDDEQENISQSVFNRTCREVFAVARKTLADLGGTSLEERIAAIFIERVNQLNAEDTAQFNGAGSAQVRSAFELPAGTQSLIETALSKKISLSCSIEFVTDTEIISGIEFSANGYKVEWNVEAYLKQLENTLPAS
ncbi:TPA: F0F1 ATP synthase subunit B [Candidatus Sumerlaeota bacterium]|jgi:F-type H+-transporting ATPase subunit b|nr:F0F1 ATP synthase subunit B [Candidatus Sumerlaeota bacterium]